MACLKCGSSWVTLNGRNMVSCPDCCKQQRCKARKQGRLPTTEIKVCARCSCEFEAVGANAIATAKYCDDCKAAAKKEWRAQWKASVLSGERVTRPHAKKQERNCQFCGNKLGGGKHKYCSTKCFHAARNAGVQSWDRTNQERSCVTRSVVNGCSPSARSLSKILNGFRGFMQKLRSLQIRISRSRCPVCDHFVNRDTSRFCSDECARQFEFSAVCARCGCSTIAKGHRGPGRRVCGSCRESAGKEARRRARRKYGKNHRSRARHHGVKYVAFPIRNIYERDGYRCQICNKQVFQKAMYRKSDGKIHPLSPTIDHIVPMSRGGNHEPDNCQTACFLCNSRKSDSGGGQLRLAIAASPSE
jgi:hypothetical protein